jgi:predicted Abi (CAAX) family protease
MTKLPYEEFAKGRVRLTPETLTQKYYGLVFGMPLLLVVLIAVIWAVVGVQTGHSSFETPANLATARLLGVGAAFVIWCVVIKMNLGDNGHRDARDPDDYADRQ